MIDIWKVFKYEIKIISIDSKYGNSKFGGF